MSKINLLKKSVSMLLVMVLALTTLVGCKTKTENSSSKSTVASGDAKSEKGEEVSTEEKELEEVTLRWVSSGSNQQKDHELVMEKVNEELAKLLPNTTLVMETYADYKDKWPMWLAANEEIDLAWSGFAFDMLAEIKKDAFLPLNDLIAEYGPTIQQEMIGFESDFNTGTYDGNLYAIPNHQPAIKETAVLRVNQELIEYLDLDAILTAAHSSSTTTQAFYDEITKFMEKVDAAEKLDKGITIQELYAFVNRRGYENVMTPAVVYKGVNDGKVVIENYFETDEFINFIKQSRAWFEKGYIRKDILTVENSRAEGGKVGGSIIGAHDTANWYQVADERGIKYAKDEDTPEGSKTQSSLLLDMKENKFLGATTIGKAATYTTIPSTSKNPERAMMLLNLIRSEEGKDLFNLLVFGIEGTHYSKVDEKKIKPVDYIGQGDANSAYGLPKWILGNVYNAYQTPDIEDGLPEYCLNYKQDTEATYYKTPLYGYVFDTDPVKTELAQIATVIEEFEGQLWSGALSDYEDVYNEMLEKLKNAGIDNVIAEAQKQADAYISK